MVKSFSLFKIASTISICLSQSGVNKPSIVNHFITDSKEIALTFDDGPDCNNTPKILSILDQYNIKATFFVLGQNAIKYPYIIKDILNKGHCIGLHTYSHPNFNHLTKSEIENEIKLNQKVVADIINYKPTIIRPPYGIVTDDFLCICAKMGLSVFTWSKDSFDWKTKNSSYQIVRNVTEDIKKGSIILMHDKSANQKNSSLALPSIIEKLTNDGFKFVTLK